MRSMIILASTAALAACNMSAEAHSGDTLAASGAGNQRTYQVSGFDGVSLGGHHNVIVKVGQGHSVRAEGDSEELDRLELRIKEGRLHIGQKKQNGWSFGHRPAVTVHVTVPALAKASVGGSGTIQVDQVQGRSFEASVGGSGDINIGSLRVQDAAFSVAGSGTIKAAGAAANARMKIAGSGDIDAAAFEARSAEVKIAGSGDARLRATETANVSIAGSGDVTVDGPAKCSVRKAGSGSLNCGS